MAQTQKFKQVMSVIERRIQRGDYVLQPLPSERRIAEETGVSHMTARKAVRALLDRNVLVRRDNGALDISPIYHPETGAASVLLLYPAFASAFLTRLGQTVSQAALKAGIKTRPVQYVHWDDPVVINAVTNRGGVIVVPSSLDVPPHILAALQSNRVVSLDLDLSDRDVPSIRLFPDKHIYTVFDHLQKQGHRRIDCISSHVHNPEIDRRIRLWRDWSYRHAISGELWERPAPSFSDPTPHAYEQMKELLARRSPKATAFVGTTFPAAIGAMRACWDRGLIVGKDIAICSMNIESPARFLTPSVTGLDIPDLSKLLTHCFDWFATDEPWTGPKRLEPTTLNFFHGESAGYRSGKVAFNCEPVPTKL